MLKLIYTISNMTGNPSECILGFDVHHLSTAILCNCFKGLVDSIYLPTDTFFLCANNMVRFYDYTYGSCLPINCA